MGTYKKGIGLNTDRSRQKYFINDWWILSIGGFIAVFEKQEHQLLMPWKVPMMIHNNYGYHTENKQGSI